MLVSLTFFLYGIEIIADEEQMCVKIFHFNCVYFGQPVSGNSVFQTTYIDKFTVEIMVSYNALYKIGVNLQKWVSIVIMFIFRV